MCRSRARPAISRVAMANRASTRMTMVMAVTTAAVVRAERLSVLGLTWRPKWQATTEMSRPKTQPLARPIHRLARGTALGSWSRKKP